MTSNQVAKTEAGILIPEMTMNDRELAGIMGWTEAQPPVQF